MDYERDDEERHDNDHAPFETSHRIILSSKTNRYYVRNEGEWKSSDTPQEMIVFAHTKVIKSSRDTVNPELYSESELQTLARKHGITGYLSAPCVSVMNGDWNTTGIWINGVMRQNNSIVLSLSSRLNANIPLRVNSLIGFARQ